MKQGDFVAGMRRQVGWFVMFGIGAIVVLLLVVSLRTDIFASKFSLYVSPPSAAAFFVGQPVKFQGFTIGRVNKIALQEQGKVTIDLHILERYHNMLHQGATVRLVKEGLIGQQDVEITPGKSSAPVLADKAFVGYESEASIEQLLLDIKPAIANADTLLRELVTLAKWVNNPDGDVRVAMANIREVSKGLHRTDVEKAIKEATAAFTRIHALTDQIVEHKVAERLSGSLAQTATVLKDIEPMVKSLGKTGPESLKNLNALLTRTDKLTRSLNGIAADLQELTPELPGLAQQSRDAIEQIRKVLDGLRGSWLFAKPEKPGKKQDVAPPDLGLHP
ncbi:MAG TPA: MlaD family protein [Mariprofundaceae bacterium]|nr:MlaD family protein [Mariprofundaceae bacterium]